MSILFDWQQSYPESAYFYELGHEVTAEVEGHEWLEPADPRAAYEHGRRRRSGVDGCGWGGRVGGAGECDDLVVVELDDGGIDADGGEELLHGVAHAAGRAAEDDDRVLRDEPLDPVLRGLGDVDGEGSAGGGGGCGGGARAELEVGELGGATTWEALHRRRGGYGVLDVPTGGNKWTNGLVKGERSLCGVI